MEAALSLAGIIYDATTSTGEATCIARLNKVYRNGDETRLLFAPPSLPACLDNSTLDSKREMCIGRAPLRARGDNSDISGDSAR